MLEEHEYSGMKLYETKVARKQAAFTYSPSLKSHYTNHRTIAEEMAANGVSWSGRERVFKDQVTSRDESFSGITKVDELSDYDAITSYMYNDKLQTVMKNMEAVINKASGKLNEPSKLVVGTKTGTFSFAHASRGLIRLPEYFSPVLNKVVDPNFVDRVGEKFIFTTKDSNGDPKTYEVEQRQRGTTEMRRLNPAGNVKFTNGGMMYTDPSRYKGHSLSFGTTVKKVFLSKSTDDLKGDGADRYIDLFMNPVQSANINKDMWLYQVLPAMLVARAFEGSGFKVAVHKAPMVNSGGKLMMNVTTLSNYDDPTNYDAIARGGGDTRMIRHHDFGIFQTMQKKHWDYDYGSSIGSPMGHEDAKQFLNEYAFWSAKQAQRNVKGFKNQNPTLYQLIYIEQGNNADVQKERAIDQFLEIMDTMGVQFQKAEQFARDAIKRYEEVLGLSRNRAANRAMDKIEGVELKKPANAEIRMPDAKFSKLAKKIEKSVEDGTKALEALKN